MERVKEREIFILFFGLDTIWVNFWIILNGGLDDMNTCREWFLNVILEVGAQGMKKKTGRLSPFAVVNEWAVFNQLFHHKTWWRPEAISRLIRTLLCIFIKRKHRKYLKNISLLFLRKTVLFLLGAIIWRFHRSKILYHRKWSLS